MLMQLRSRVHAYRMEAHALTRSLRAVADTLETIQDVAGQEHLKTMVRIAQNQIEQAQRINDRQTQELAQVSALV